MFLVWGFFWYMSVGGKFYSIGTQQINELKGLMVTFLSTITGSLALQHRHLLPVCLLLLPHQ